MLVPVVSLFVLTVVSKSDTGLDLHFQFEKRCESVLSEWVDVILKC
jgi:hypothetical protein